MGYGVNLRELILKTFHSRDHRQACKSLVLILSSTCRFESSVADNGEQSITLSALLLPQPKLLSTQLFLGTQVSTTLHADT